MSALRLSERPLENWLRVEFPPEHAEKALHLLETQLTQVKAREILSFELGPGKFSLMPPDYKETISFYVTYR